MQYVTKITVYADPDDRYNHPWHYHDTVCERDLEVRFSTVLPGIHPSALDAGAEPDSWGD